MPTSEIACSRDACANTFRVGGEESARCPECGEEHSAPWPHDEPSQSSDTDTTTLTAPAGATVRITIEIEPPRSV